MANLGNPKKTFEILQKYQFQFEKKFGQNFLIDTFVLEKIIRNANVTKNDFVLEIGPGIGTLTQYLAEAAGKVVAIEIDKNLIPILEETLSEYENVEIINQDILKVDIAALVQAKNNGMPIKVVANLPYYITTPIIMSLFEADIPLESITVMIQKEVAQRMASAPGTKEYGALSIAVQFYAKPYLAANVPPHCFVPRPKVGSAVICLEKYKNPPVTVKDKALMFQLVRGAFNQRRKTLVNALANFQDLSFSKEQVLQCIEQLGLGADIRGERLALADFAHLADLFYEMNNE